MNIPHKRTILDLPRYIKDAREKAVLGKYELSLEQYKKCLKLIESYVYCYI